MKASFYTVNLSGAIGMKMGGYAERDKGNIGIHDDIYKKICVIENDGKYFAIGSGDYIGVNKLALETVRKRVNEATNIPEENIVLCATHTHSSYSATRVDRSGHLKDIVMDPEPSELDYSYFDLMVEKIIGGFIHCYNNLEEVRIGYGRDNIEGLGSNRNNPENYHDKSVHVIRVNRLDGSLLGTIVTATCHPTILDSSNYLISSDYPGYFRNVIETIYPDSTCIFLQGPAGEISTRYTRRESGFKEAERMGKLLAGKVIEILSKIEDDTIDIKSFSPKIVFNTREYPEDNVLIKNIENIKTELDKLIKEGADESIIRKQYVTLQGAERILNYKKSIDFNSVESYLQIVDFGPFKFVGIPGEPFGEIAIDIRKFMGEDTIITGYCNDYIGYIVSTEGLERDGYEKDMMIIEKDAHKIIVDEVKQIYEILNK